MRDESEASPPTLPTSQRPPLCDQLSHIFSPSNFRSQACAPNRPGGALFPMAPAELGASWTFEVSHVMSRAADQKVPFQCVFTSIFNMHWSRIGNV